MSDVHIKETVDDIPVLGKMEHEKEDQIITSYILSGTRGGRGKF